MKISVFGTGYVGLVTGAAFAEAGHTVLCADTDPGKISTLEQGAIPFFEPGLPEMAAASRAAGRLAFTTDVAAAAAFGEVLFLAVGTPMGDDGSANLEYLFAAAKGIARDRPRDRPGVLVVKSTVPVGTGARLAALLAELGADHLAPASNPEFLREGRAVEDARHPDRIVTGAGNETAHRALAALYESWRARGVPYFAMDVLSAEMVKYAANAFLAIRLAYINEVADACAASGADIRRVKEGMGADARIGSHYLQPGPGYGGSCFPKDTRALAYWARAVHSPMPLVDAAIASNEDHKRRIAAQVADGIPAGGTCAVLGLAFKDDTDDIRESPAIAMIETLLARGVRVVASDPAAIANARKVPALSAVRFEEDVYRACADADAVLLATEWAAYRALDWGRIARALRGKRLFDARNLLDGTAMEALGFSYRCVGLKARG